MELKLINTLGGDLQAFKPGNKDQVNFYSCGPTVYNFVHIGNLRAYIFADTVKRVLQFNGFNVDWVMNITDIDDKTIAGAVKEKGSKATPADLREFTDQYFLAFLEDLKKINVDEQDINFIKVTEKIADIQLYIVELLKKGFAYKAEDGSIYFSIQKYQEKFGDYGELVGKKFLEGKKIGARVKVDEYEKDNLSDFALWKARTADDGNIFWDHPDLGPGRPGWHIECTLINYFKFPNGTDIHTGGVDLIFPHHTNEIAQAQALYKPFVQYWLHSEHILVDSKKMSKSAGNFYTLRDLEQQGIANGTSLRYLILQSHYRSKLNVTKESLKSAKEGLENLHRQIENLLAAAGNAKGRIDTAFEKEFATALNNDLNTPEALAIVQKTLISGELNAGDKLATVYRMDEALGLGLENIKAKNFLSPDELAENILQILQKRDQARKEKDFELSDKLRTELEEHGYEVADTPEGTKLRLK